MTEHRDGYTDRGYAREDAHRLAIDLGHLVEAGPDDFRDAKTIREAIEKQDAERIVRGTDRIIGSVALESANAPTPSSE